MTQAKTYRAFVHYGNDKPSQQWTGLTKGQAQWRYHWVKRNWWNLFRDFQEYGWQREE